MSEFVYLQEPGILYDMLFALRMRFNGERTYLLQNQTSADPKARNMFCEKLIEELSFASEKMLALLYWNNATGTKTGLATHFWNNIDQLKFYEEGFIERFYDSLRNVESLKKTIYANYISKDVPESFSIETFASIRDTVYATSLPADVKLYLLDFFVFGEKEIERFIADLRKTEMICRKIWKTKQSVIEPHCSNYDEDSFSQLSKIHRIDILKFEKIHVTYCAASCETIAGKFYGNKWISFIGTNQFNCIRTYSNSELNWYELGRILYDETRLKILKMLREKKMYCAEIARELGLKNNSTLYHLNMMEKQRVILSTQDGKKRMYFVNSQKINSIISYLNSLQEGTSNGNSKQNSMEKT